MKAKINNGKVINCSICQNKKISSIVNNSDAFCADVTNSENINANSTQRGPQGIPGEAATIQLGTVTTGAAGSDVIITNSGTENAAVFNFTIPRGDRGEQGEQGIQGETGADGYSPTATVTKSGDTATITITDKNGTTTTTISDGSSGASSVSELTDVDLTGLSNGDVLVYDSTSQEWKAEAQSGGVTDVEVNGESVVTGGVAEIDLSNYQTTIEAGENITVKQPVTIRVPEGYTQLERINSSSAACCIDTGLTGTIKWEIDALGTSPYPTKRALIATDGNGSAFFGQYSSSTAWGTNGGSTGVAVTDRINLIINFTTTGCNGTINGTSFSYSATGDLSTNWVLFGTSSYGTRLYGYLYSAKATQNGLVVFDGVPAVRDSDHVSGLYDVVSGNFFTSATTTEFSAGSVLSTNTVVSANVGNGTLTISRYGTTLATFTANSTSNVTANMTNPAIQPKEIGASSILNSSTTKAINSLLYCGNDNLVHSYTETTVPISMAYGMFVNSSQLSANSSISYYYRGEKLGWSVPSAMRIFTARHKVWARCTYPDSSGNVYFVSLYDQNGSTNTLQGGYTYYYLGCASSTTTIALDVTGSHFLSINTDGKLTHIDGVEVAVNLNGKADVDLSNLTTTSSPNFDGQWVESFSLIANEVTIPTSANDDYSLSSYLPNDNYNYEVMLEGSVTTASTSGSLCNLRVTTDVITVNPVYICGIRTRTASTMSNMSSVIVPVGAGRSVSVNALSSMTGNYILAALAYRRIGTNT